MQSEFDLIGNLKSKYGLNHVGDDCAVLPKDDVTDQLLTADMLIEDIDFRLEWTTPELLGAKALSVSLSDIAAMCGEPKWAMLSLGIPETLWSGDFVERFYEGWFACADGYKVELVGGDISRSPDKLVIDSIVGGDVAKDKAVLRSTAKPGDLIFISGALGGAAAGLKLMENGVQFNPDDNSKRANLIWHQLQVVPALTLATYLTTKNLATSAIDVSDGLSSDLQHICDASRVGAQIEFDRLPFNGFLFDEFTPEECENFALHGGEDYVLLFTTRTDVTQFPDEFLVTPIGKITAEGGRIELIRNGRSSNLSPRGFRHF